MGTSLIQIGQALSGASLPIAYGPVRARGNNLINQQLADNSRVALYILGEGVWDGIDRLWINGKLANAADTTLVHFHNGFDGTLGAGLAPSSNGGDQLVDNFWSLLPANFQPLTFSRKAYLMVHAPADPQAPSNTLDVIGDYRTARVRIFDATGAQTAFQYSLNPAWQILDLVLRQMLQREWTAAGAAAAGGDLSAAQKARINFQSFKTCADICDTVLASGAKTFEGGVAYPSMAGLPQALNQLAMLSQTYLLEQSGQITLLPDEARASTFVMTSAHITAGSFEASKSQLRGAQNRFIGTFNDLQAQKNADIDTVGNVGLSRTANVVTVKVPAGQVHGFLANDNVDIVNPTDASFAGTITVATVIDARNFTGAQNGANATSGGGYVGTTVSRFAQRTKVIDHEAHQLAVGQRGLALTPTYKRVPVSIDFGNNTMERVERILNFIKVRNLGADTTPYIAPFTATIQASAYSVDAGGNVLMAQLPGDIITLDSTISEEFQGDYEIMKLKYSRPAADGSNQQTSGADQSGNAETITLTLLQYLPGAFSTLSDAAQFLVASIARNGLAPVAQLDGSGNQVVSLAKTIDDTPTGRMARRSHYVPAGNGVATWYKLGTWTFITDGQGHSIHLEMLSGNGYNTNSNQQALTDIWIRSSNGISGAPNISGASWTLQGNTNAVLAVKIVAVGGSVLQTNGAWEIWVQIGPFGDYSLHIDLEPSDTFVNAGTAGADPGVAGTTIVVAAGGGIVDTTGITLSRSVDFARNYTNKHMGNVPDDAGSSRFAVSSIDGSRKALVDFASGHSNKHMGNVPDDAGSSRFAVSSIDGARKALVDFASGHTNKVLGNIADDGTYYRPRNSSPRVSNNPYNGDFEIFSDSKTIADGWNNDLEIAPGGQAIFSRSAAPFYGNFAQNIAAGSSTAGGGLGSRPIAVRPNTKYELSCRYVSNVATTSGVFLRILWYKDDADFTRASASQSAVRMVDDCVSNGAAGVAWAFGTGTFTSPSDAKFARVAVYCWEPNVVATFTFDSVSFRPADVANVDGGIDANGNVILKNKSNAAGSTSSPSTSSTTYSVIPEMTQTITTLGNKVLIIFSCSLTFSGLNSDAAIAIFKDGVQLSQSYTYGVQVDTPVCLSLIDFPSAASHTYDIRWKINSANPGTVAVQGTARTLQVVELG